MPYEIYKMIHLLGLFLLISGLITAFTLTSNGHALAGKVKTFAFALHGLGLVLILVSGFGLAARLGLVGGLPTWVKAKIGVWVVVGLIVILIRKMKLQVKIWLPLVLALFTMAAYLAVNKVGV